ncbi:hypothetical protein PHMEG_000976 [Phytophthora megakarya]|uniref:Uncharacterized protein n=1 Tax=Phytophthora megakarya TaxID=4795 RepID=A0A225X2B8_9STRA|nr:hypothetical protein PHMEG_000976 [Phytophthora megakarya]
MRSVGGRAGPANFTALDIVGQMTEIAIRVARLHVRSYIGLYMSVLGEINGSWGWTTAEIRAFVHRIQEIAMEENGGHPMIYGVDDAPGNALVW